MFGLIRNGLRGWRMQLIGYSIGVVDRRLDGIMYAVHIKLMRRITTENTSFGPLPVSGENFFPKASAAES